MRQKDNRLNGLNPLSYIGANAYSPPNLTIDNRSPTANDSSNFYVGSIWIDTSASPEEVYILTSLDSGSATWQAMTLGTSLPVLVPEGGTGLTSITDHSLVVGSGVNALTELGVAASGKIVIGSTGADPVLASLGSGTGIDVTEGAGTLSVDVSSIIPKSFPTDSGTAVASGGLTITGGNNANTVGSGSTVTVHATTAVDVATTYTTDSGNATPATNTLSIIGAGGATTSGSGSTITVTAGAGSAGANTCSFAAYQSTDNGDPSTTLSGVYLGDTVAMTELYDTGGNFTPGDGAGTAAIFTAPQAGKYILQMNVSYISVSLSGNINFSAEIETTSGTYKSYDDLNVSSGAINSTHKSRAVSIVVDMLSGETAKFFCFSTDSVTGTYKILGNDSGGEYLTFVSGSLLELAVSTGSGISSFLAHQATDGGDPAFSSGGISLGEAVVMSEIYDTGGNFTVGDGAGTAAVFTAPLDSKYSLNINITISLLGAPSSSRKYYCEIITTARTYRKKMEVIDGGTFGFLDRGIGFSVIADMSVGDTATFYIYSSSGGVGQQIIMGDEAGGEYLTFVSGTLV